MIYIGINIINPYSNRFDTIMTKFHSVTQNKSIEYGFYKTNVLLEASLNITAAIQEHKGFSIGLGLAGYSFDFTFYDNRHKYY